MKIKMGSISIALFYTSLTLADVPVIDISQQISGQDASAKVIENNNTSDTCASMASATVPATTSTENPVPSTIMSTTTTDLTKSQQLTRLEQQMDNITDMNLPQQVSDLQQQLAQIRGQLQVQMHNLQLLNNQQYKFYQDLNQRITKLKTLNSNDASNNNSFSHSSSFQKSSASSILDSEILDSETIQLQNSKTYRAALDLLEKKQYEKAKAAFQNYLDNCLNGYYVANAHYWLGEIYLQQKNIHKAATEFQIIRDRFPKSKKMLDAELKLAIIHANMGNTAKAKRELMEIKKKHPESTVAQLANIHLQQLESDASISITP